MDLKIDYISLEKFYAPDMNQLLTEVQNFMEIYGITKDAETLDQVVKCATLLATQAGYYASSFEDNAYTLSALSNTQPIIEYRAGMQFITVISANNTGASTVNIAGVGVKNLKRGDGSALQANDLIAGSICKFYYNGTEFRLYNNSLIDTSKLLIDNIKTKTTDGDIGIVDSSNNTILTLEDGGRGFFSRFGKKLGSFADLGGDGSGGDTIDLTLTEGTLLFINMKRGGNTAWDARFYLISNDFNNGEPSNALASQSSIIFTFAWQSNVDTNTNVYRITTTNTYDTSGQVFVINLI